MQTCEKYNKLSEYWKQYIVSLINAVLVGKSDTSEIKIEDSDLKTYALKATVVKNKNEKETTIIGYLRSDAFKGGRWEITKRPRLMSKEIAPAGVKGIYG